MRHIVRLFTLLAICWAATAQAEGPAWQPLLGDLTKTEKAGYGGLCGMVVDPATGTLWINVSDRGFYQSDDQGRSFRRVSDTQPKGRTESPGCALLDPTGKSRRLVTALVYGSPISVSDDGCATWKSLHGKSGHVDWCGVDWSDPQMKFVIALKHEASGLLLVSRDGGATFEEAGKDFGSGWVFDGKTAVVTKVKSKTQPNNVLMRTTDSGATWQPCGEFKPVGLGSAQALPKWHGDSLYWLTDAGLIATSDQGATWKTIGPVKDARYGPVFGKDARQMFVLTSTGIVESTDGGASWSAPIPFPADFKVGGLSWLAYDPQHDVVYVMKMTSDLYKLDRQAPVK